MLAEQLFGYIWSQHGSKTALHQVLDAKQHLELAQFRFDKGCELWSRGDLESALDDIEKSRAIQLAQGSWCSPEMEVQLHYALGMIRLGQGDCSKALAEFRQAWRISGITLETGHLLTESSQQMIENVLSKQGYRIMEIHHELNVLRQAIVHEKRGDYQREMEDFDLALYEYRQSILEYQRHQDQPQVDNAVVEQAAIRCKIASTLESKGSRRLAETEWATALSLYASCIGSRHPTTIETMTHLTRNHSFL